jgi:hypothetical protein
MLKKWFTRTTPFVVIAVISAIVILVELIIERGGPEGIRLPLLLKLFFFLVTISAIDVLLKFYFKKNYNIWIIEIIMCLGLFYYWIVT